MLALSPLRAQEKIWTLSECIDYALNENIQVRRAGVSTAIGEINLQQARDNRWPDLSATARESFGWQNETDGVSGVTTFNGSNSTSLSLSSGVTLFSGFQAQNDIKKAGISYESLQYSTAETKEAVSVNMQKNRLSTAPIRLTPHVRGLSWRLSAFSLGLLPTVITCR
jgi:outer membrane protein